MHTTPDALPQLRQAPIRHEFRRVDDLISWTRPLLGIANFDVLPGEGPYQSSHRDLALGGLHLSRTDYSGGGIHMSVSMEERLLFTLNAKGKTSFHVKGQQLAPPACAGITMITPTEGRYIRGNGGGLLLSLNPKLLLQTAQAIQGPLAEELVRQRLKKPLSFFSYTTADCHSIPNSLLKTLHLVDGLLDPLGNVPAALRLDDLITRQLVLMLAPELLDPGVKQSEQYSAASFEELLDWIVSRIDQPLSLSEIELRSGYSRRTLQRTFQLRFGCSPMNWLRQRRLAQALEQLTQGGANASVSWIAKRCGYHNLSSFSRDFSKAYGRSPSEVLRANRSLG